MIKFLHKAFSVSIALLLLVSTTSWMVEKHYCMGHLMDTAFFSNAKTCEMDMEMDKETAVGFEPAKSCCSNELIVVDGQDNLKLSLNDIELNQYLFLVSFTFSYMNLFEGLPPQVIPYKNYTPPLIVKDIPVLHDTFLI